MNELWDWDQAGSASRLALIGSLQSDRIDLRGVRAWDQYVMQVIAVPTTSAQSCLYLEWLRQFPGYATECVAKIDGKRITRADLNRFRDERRGRKEAIMKPAIRVKAAVPILYTVHDDEVTIVASEVGSATAEAQRLEILQKDIINTEAINQGAATTAEEGLGAAMAETQRLEAVQRKLTTMEATNQEGATIAEEGLGAAMAEAQRLEAVQRKLTTIEATNQEAATLAEKGLEVTLAEAERLEAVQRKLTTIELANQAAAAIAENGLEAATVESLRVSGMQLEVDTIETANGIALKATNEAKYNLVAATRERQQPPIWISVNAAGLSTRSPVAACSYTAEGALGSETVWQLEGDRHCRAAVILPVAGAPDWRTLSPGRKSTVDFFVSEPMSDWTTVAVQDKAYDARSTVSCVGRGLFRFSNANTRFNQEVPQPLAGHDGQVEYTLVTLRGTSDDIKITAKVSSQFTPFKYSLTDVLAPPIHNDFFQNMERWNQVYEVNVCLTLPEGLEVAFDEMRFISFRGSENKDYQIVFSLLRTALWTTEAKDLFIYLTDSDSY